MEDERNPFAGGRRDLAVASIEFDKVAQVDHAGITRQIAEGAKDSVRAAMADLEMWIG